MQTEAYTRALFMLGGRIPEERIEAAVRARMQRQAVLQRADRPEATFYVHEDVLHRRVGDDKIMEEQLLRLMFNTHVLRVVASSTGAAGALGGTHMLWRYDKNKPVVYSETAMSRVFAQAPEAVKLCEWHFARLDRIAMDEGQSRSLLMSCISSPRKDPHAPGAHVA